LRYNITVLNPLPLFNKVLLSLDCPVEGLFFVED
jgi:hypothetical protein